METKQIAPGVRAIAFEHVNAFLVDGGDGLTLIDTGLPGSADTILDAVREMGKQPGDIKHILVTHCHPDHSGGLAALQRETAAPAYMHPTDAAMVRQGKGLRPMKPSPPYLPALLFLLRSRPKAPLEPAEIQCEVQDGDELPISGGMKAIHVPGHCAGQLAFLWPRHGGILFAADAAANFRRLGLMMAYEDLAEGRRSLAKLAALQFETAAFGHGHEISQGASAQFKQKWGNPRT